jgi:hypothetical protein
MERSDKAATRTLRAGKDAAQQATPNANGGRKKGRGKRGPAEMALN